MEWSAPAVENRPSPCGAMTFTRISDHHAVMFGGNYKEMNARSDDLFIFDLEKKVCIVYWAINDGEGLRIGINHDHYQSNLVNMNKFLEISAF